MISPRFYQFARFASAVVLGMFVPIVILLPTAEVICEAAACLALTAWLWLWLRPDDRPRLEFTPQLRRRRWHPSTRSS